MLIEIPVIEEFLSSGGPLLFVILREHHTGKFDLSLDTNFSCYIMIIIIK
jgi:hypothetical protein